MKSSTRLDSALFQLTPTRTRCDLIISANGKTEKLASGLLKPFLAHLKTAQEQMAKGGYSIILEQESDRDASWFTKGTVERFVRFVSTPEVLERVYTLESEILQIEEAIVIQGSSEVAPSTIEDSPVKPMESTEASRTSPDTSDEKAIVLYKPGVNPPESNGTTAQGENSKVQLLKVLETRKTVLQKEQGMAFARAVAAGFDIDNISPLMSFSECFGASRLRDACKRFNELWKKKHETGQWVEIEAAEAMPNRADFTAMNASGIMLSSLANAELASESNGKSSSLTEEKPTSEHHTPQGHPEYFQGQFPHQMFPHWPIQSPPGTVPVYQPYPMQGMPYYPNYPGPGPFFQPPYPANDDPRLNPGLRMGQKRHSMDSSNGNAESENWDVDPHRTRSLDEAEFERESRKRGNRSGKKQGGGVVVIRNINYITSKGQSHSDDDGSESGSESEGNGNDASVKSAKKKENADSTEADGGHWEAFQNFLLRDADDNKLSSDQGMFSAESKAQSKRRQSRTSGDPILFGGQDNGESRHGGTDIQNMSGTACMRRSSTDEPMMSRRDGSNGDVDGEGDILSSEANGRRFGYQRDKRQSNNMDDDSYIVSLKGQGVKYDGRSAVDMDSELPSANHKVENRQVSGYEPEELSMMPHRGAEDRSVGYGPDLDYEMQGGPRSKRNKEAVSDSKQGSNKVLDKGLRSRLLQDDKKKNVGPIRRAKPSKLSPLEEARARAEKLRTFKADLQKMKKEKEAEEMKRLETLKMERQKRIAARGGSTLPSQPVRKQAPTRASLSSLRGSKFSDSEPGSTSPLQRYPTRTASVGSNDSQKTSKTVSRLSALSRSAASLPAPKKESGDAGAASETKAASMARLRRLSEPKISNHPIASLRAKSTGTALKPKASDSSEVKKLSAIVNHDKGKAATLPELKIRASKGPEASSQSKSTQKGSSSVKSLTAPENAEAKKKNEKLSQSSDLDENPIVEKTVVVLECEKPSAPSQALVSKTATNTVEREPTERQIVKQTTTYEVATSIDVAEKPYQAPYARASSFEDPCTENSEYGKAAPTSLEPVGSASFKAQVFDSRGLKLEKIPEVAEKPQAKGFRRLLKLGRKSSSSAGERNSESDNVNVSSNGCVGDDSEVHTLKTLISQDETPTPEATSQKSSRHFSLLSPFRSSKSGEKKPAT